MASIAVRQRRVAFGLLGDALDGLGRTADAFAAYTRMNELIVPLNAARRSEPAQATGSPGPASRHAFLLGYPRSGTTLVENVLASLPDLDGKTFVDMAPLNGTKLPMIARLFPQAVVVLCRRDPRDVVLSRFKRNFRVHASTCQFTSLDSTVRHYDAVMPLMEKHLQVLPRPVHVVDYAGLRDFSRTAAERDIRTASAPQVRQGLFDGTRQWLRYCEQMEAVLPALERWAVRFGYEV